MEEDLQFALAVIAYMLLVAILAVLARNLATALVAAYIVALAARSSIANVFTRTMLVLASIAVLPLTPLILTPPGPARLPLPLHTLLVYTPPPPHPSIETHVVALDWGQVGAITLLAEYLNWRRATAHRRV